MPKYKLDKPEDMITVLTKVKTKLIKQQDFEPAAHIRDAIQCLRKPKMSTIVYQVSIDSNWNTL